ncbi:MAG: hypothetical protein HFJ17_00850 [Clostridia bacterium]|nr:hypothetical protein [Clostridia bacterium]
MRSKAGREFAKKIKQQTDQIDNDQRRKKVGTKVAERKYGRKTNNKDNTKNAKEDIKEYSIIDYVIEILQKSFMIPAGLSNEKLKEKLIEFGICNNQMKYMKIDEKTIEGFDESWDAFMKYMFKLLEDQRED